MRVRFDERVLNGMDGVTVIVNSDSFTSAGELLDMSQSVSAAPWRGWKRLCDVQLQPLIDA